MEEQVIKFETAKLAKERGFEVPKLKRHEIKCGQYYSEFPWCDDEGYEIIFPRITQSALQTWLRKKHNINVWVEKHPDDERYFPQCPEALLCNGIGIFLAYEDAMEAMLVVALNLIKTNTL
jgi:hypothetical protein